MSQPTREKMKKIAGSKSSSSRISTTSGFETFGIRERPRSNELFDFLPLLIFPIGTRSFAECLRTSSALTLWLLVPGSKSSSSSSPNNTCWSRGTGRISETTITVSPRTSSSQAPNSSALETVALRETRTTSLGRCKITSSQTAPLKRSAR